MFARFELIKNNNQIDDALNVETLQVRCLVVPLLYNDSEAYKHLLDEQTVSFLEELSGNKSNILCVKKGSTEIEKNFYKQLFGLFYNLNQKAIKRPSIVVLCLEKNTIYLFNNVPDGRGIEHLLVDIVTAINGSNIDRILKLLEIKFAIIAFVIKNKQIIEKIINLMQKHLTPSEI